MTSNFVIVTFKGRPYNSIERLLSPFDSITWGCILSCILLGIVAIMYLLSKPEKNLARTHFIGRKTQFPILDLISVIFNNPVKSPQITFTKFMLMCWIVLFLILRVAYQANLYGILKSNRSKPIPRNLKEIVADNFSLYCTENIGKLFLNNSDFQKLFIILDSFVQRQDNDSRVSDIVLLDWLLEQSVDSKKGVVVSEESFYYYKMQNQKRSSQLTLVKGQVLTQNIAFSLKKHSIYKPYLDEVLDGLRTGGLVDLWKKNRSWYKGKKFEKSNKTATILSIDKILVAFNLVVVGCTIASVVFLVEIFEKRLL